MLNLYSCADGRGGSSQVSVWLKGSFLEDSSSTTYYTDETSASGLSSSATSATFTEISNWGCSTKAIILASPIIVGSTNTSTSTSTGSSPTPTPTASLTQTLTVLVDPTYLANSSSNNSAGMGGCKVAPGGGRGVCVTIPAVLPYVGTDTTTTKRFLIAHSATSTIDDTKANAIVIVPMAGTVPLTAFAAPYFSSTSAAGNSNTSNTNLVDGGPSYNTSTDVSSFRVNTDGSIQFYQGGSSDTNAGSFGTFSLSDHSSTLTTRDGNTTWYYRAISF